MFGRGDTFFFVKEILNAELESVRSLEQDLQLIFVLLVRFNPLEELLFELFLVLDKDIIGVGLLITFEHFAALWITQSIPRMIYSGHLSILIHPFHLLRQRLVEHFHLVVHVELSDHLFELLFVYLVLFELVTHHLNS